MCQLKVFRAPSSADQCVCNGTQLRRLDIIFEISLKTLHALEADDQRHSGNISLHSHRITLK